MKSSYAWKVWWTLICFVFIACLFQCEYLHILNNVGPDPEVLYYMNTLRSITSLLTSLELFISRFLSVLHIISSSSFEDILKSLGTVWHISRIHNNCLTGVMVWTLLLCPLWDAEVSLCICDLVCLEENNCVVRWLYSPLPLKRTHFCVKKIKHGIIYIRAVHLVAQI